MQTRNASEGMWLFKDGFFVPQVTALTQEQIDAWEEVNEAWKDRYEAENTIQEVGGDYGELLNEKQAMQNALSAMFDGIKTVSDPAHPVPVTFPMYVIANVYYQYDGAKYVCSATGTINSAERLDDFMTEVDW